MKEKLYVHVLLNHAWMLGFMHVTGDTMAGIKRSIQDIFKRRVEAVESPCSITLVVGTWDRDPGKVFVKSNGKFGIPAPKGSKAKEVERVAVDAVVFVLAKRT
jgi:hypothetical protein